MASKSGSRGNSQLRWFQGLMASSDSQRQIVVSQIDATIPREMASRFSSDMLKRDKGSPCSYGSSQARALMAITTLGGKAPRPPTPRSFVEPLETLFEKALAPLADDLG